jgi:hypothetical protein
VAHGDADPPLAISQAKSLIEATAKVVLGELNVTYDEKRDDVPALVKKMQKELNLHPELAAPDRIGADIVKKILGILSGVAVGLGELLNEYEPDHGRGAAKGDLDLRFVVELAAALGCDVAELLFDAPGEPRDAEDASEPSDEVGPADLETIGAHWSLSTAPGRHRRCRPGVRLDPGPHPPRPPPPRGEPTSGWPAHRMARRPHRQPGRCASRRGSRCYGPP